jgi:hypothetical protein
LELYLLGPPRLVRAGQPVVIGLRKALAEAAYQQGQFSTSRQHLRPALKLATHCGFGPALLIGFYHTACLMLQELAQGGRSVATPVTAPELLTRVAAHPHAWYAFRSRAQNLLTQQGSGWPVAQEGDERATETADLRLVVDKILAWL